MLNVYDRRFELLYGDCLELMKQIPDNSIDMVLCDLPYGVTRCAWDIQLDMHKLWDQYKRIVKDNGAILLFTMQPFTSLVVMSNLQMFKYEWIYEKVMSTGFLNAKKQPLRAHENIEVFYKKLPVYNPQMVPGVHRINAVSGKNECYNKFVPMGYRTGSEYYPRSIQKFNNAVQNKKIHSNEKPVDMLEYFIKTYTNEYDVVLDNCAGSMSTCIAAVNTQRYCICMENNYDIFLKGKKRVLEYTGDIQQEVNS